MYINHKHWVYRGYELVLSIVYHRYQIKVLSVSLDYHGNGQDITATDTYNNDLILIFWRQAFSKHVFSVNDKEYLSL